MAYREILFVLKNNDGLITVSIKNQIKDIRETTLKNYNESCYILERDRAICERRDNYKSIAKRNKFVKKFLKHCRKRELRLNCTESRTYSSDKINEAKRKFIRIVFKIDDDNLIMPSEDLTMELLTEYQAECNETYLCQERDRYKQMKNWHALWKLAFEKCLQKLQLNCQNIAEINETALQTFEDKYSSVEFTSLKTHVETEMKQVNLSLVTEWNETCYNPLYVSCDNFSTHLHETNRNLSTYSDVIFLIDNIDANLTMVRKVQTLRDDFVNEFQSSCTDAAFKTATCDDRFDAASYRSILKHFYDECSKDRLHISCTESQDEETFHEVKKLYKKIAFAAEDGDAMVVNSSGVDFSVVKEYAEGCKDEYACSEMNQYMQLASWTMLWKRIFEKCVVTLTCANIDSYSIADLKDYLKFNSPDGGEYMMKTFDANTTIVQKWKDSCSQTLAIDCCNFSKYLELEYDFENSKRIYDAVTFTIRTVEEQFAIEIASSNLNYSFVKEYESFCERPNVTCMDRNDTLANMTDFKSIIGYIFAQCWKHEFHVNCTSSKSYSSENSLKEIKEYQRIAFHVGRSDVVVLNSNDVTLSIMTEYSSSCKDEYSCSSRTEYKKLQSWKTIWEKAFEKCVRDLNITCSNIDLYLNESELYLNETELNNAKKEHLNVNFLSPNLERTASLLDINAKIIQKWKNSCEYLIVDCRNYSKYLYHGTDFEKKYSKIIFLINTIDVQFGMNVFPADLNRSFIAEYAGFCNDLSINCKDRNDDFKNATLYKTFFKYFSEKCQLREFYVNCTNSKNVLSEMDLDEIKQEYQRVTFDLGRIESVILNVDDVNVFLMKEYSLACKEEYVCSNRSEYKKLQNWQILWKKVFQKCSKDLLSLTCHNIDPYLNETELADANDEYRNIEFSSHLKTESNVSNITTTVIEEWKNTCSNYLTVDCHNFSSHLERKIDFEQARKTYDKIIFNIEILDAHLRKEISSENLNYSFVVEYDKSCQHPQFRNTSCKDRKEKFENVTDYQTVVESICDECFLHELCLNCTNASTYLVEKNLLAVKQIYPRIVFYIKRNDSVILDSEDVTLSTIEEYTRGCESKYYCLDRSRYEKFQTWTALWERQFEKCLNVLIINCTNIKTYVIDAEFKKTKDKYVYVEFSSPTEPVASLNMLDARVDDLKKWENSCPESLTVDCYNYSEHLKRENDFDTSRKTYKNVMFIIRNIDERRIETVSSKLNYSFVDEYESSCEDPSFWETHCEDMSELENATRYKTLTRYLSEECALREFHVNCSTSKNLTEERFNELKQAFHRVTFQNEVIMNINDVNISALKEYSSNCKDRYFCSEKNEYKRLEYWKAMWKKVFAKCLKELLTLTCFDVDAYLNETILEDAKNEYRNVAFTNKTIQTLHISLNDIINWKDSCLKILTVDCRNFSAALVDFENARLYNKIIFKIENIDEQVEMLSGNLNRSFVEEYETSCEDPLFGNTSCESRNERLINVTSYGIVVKYLFEKCSRRELRINCTGSGKFLNRKYLDEIKQKYQRIVFRIDSSNDVIMNVNDVHVSAMKEYSSACKDEYFCSEQDDYKKLQSWQTLWKRAFKKCTKDLLIITCSNINDYEDETELENAKEEYRTVKFSSLNETESLNTFDMDMQRIEKWSKPCFKSLTVDCRNFSKHLRRKIDFERTQRLYHDVVFVIENIDEQFERHATSENLNYSFVQQYIFSCEDPSFRYTSCKDRNEQFVNVTNYNLFIEYLNEECLQHELVLNCTTAKDYLFERDLIALKHRYERIGFVMMRNVVILNTKDLTLSTVEEYGLGCRNKHFCFERSRYEKLETWSTLWEKTYERCLELLILTCSNINAYAKNRSGTYRNIEFTSPIGNVVALKTSQINDAVLQTWKKSCPSSLIVDCRNFSKHLTPQHGFDESKETYDKLIFVIEHVDNRFGKEIVSTNLTYSFVEQYRSSCKDPRFKNATCKDRYEMFENTNYRTIVQHLSDECSLHELYVDCTSSKYYTTEQNLQGIKNTYHRIVFRGQYNNVTLDTNDVVLSVMKEYNSRCKDEYFCSNRGEYEKLQHWKTLWKKVFQNCSQNCPNQNISNVHVEDIETCKSLIVDCRNFSKSSYKTISTVVFIIENVEEVLRKAIAVENLNESFINEYASACQSTSFKTTNCKDRHELKNVERYKSIVEIFSNACSLREFRLNCTNSRFDEVSLKKTKANYKRFVFDTERGKDVTFDSKHVDLLLIKEYNLACKTDYFCKDRERYRKLEHWKSLWEKAFDKCLKDRLILTCSNVSNYKTDALLYRNIEFKPDGGGKKITLVADDAGETIFKKWTSLCSTILYVNCANYSKHLASAIDFESSMKMYKKITFDINNVDIKTSVEKTVKNLTRDFIDEYKSSCLDTKFQKTTCNDRFKRFKNVKYRNVLNVLFTECSKDELTINCTTGKPYKDARNLTSAKAKHKRLFFDMDDSDPIILNSGDTHLSLLLEYMTGCKHDYFCSDRKEYSKRENWETYWKQIFDKCLKEAITLSCRNVSRYLTKKKLDEVQNEYRRIRFLTEDHGKMFMVDSEKTKTKDIKQWKDSCVKLLTVNCPDVSMYLNAKDLPIAKKRYVWIKFVFENVDGNFTRTVRSANLNKIFVNQFNSSCQDPRFRNTGCASRYGGFKNATYGRVVKIFNDECARHELLVNCNNVKAYTKAEELQRAGKQYKRISFSGEGTSVVDAKQINLTIVEGWSLQCRNVLTVNCANYTRHLNTEVDFESSKKLFHTILFVIDNVDLNIKLQMKTDKLEYKFLKEFKLSCQDKKFRKAHCVERYEKLSSAIDYKNILEAYDHSCSRHELRINCSNVNLYFNNEKLKRAKAKHSRILFEMDHDVPSILQKQKVTINLLKEYSNGCKDDLHIICKDRAKYKTYKNWTTYWKNVFDQCLKDQLVLTCRNVRNYTDPKMLRKAKDIYSNIGFRNFEKLILLDTLRVSTTVVRLWSESCLDELTLSCKNFSKYVNLPRDLTKTKKRYSNVTFTLSAAEKVSIRKTSGQLNHQFVKEFKSSCKDPLFKTARCQNRYKEKTKGYPNILLHFHQSCSAREFYVNCSSVKDIAANLNQLREKFDRFAIPLEGVKYELVSSRSKTIASDLKRFEESCEELPCSARDAYKKRKNWVKDFKNKFDRCLKDVLVLDCGNIMDYQSQKNLDAARDAYRKIGFVLDDTGKKYVMDASKVSSVVLRKWKGLCSKLLMVTCRNFSQHLIPRKKFEKSVQRYDVNFELGREMIRMEKSALTFDFVKEYEAACKDPSLESTKCINRYDPLNKMKRYKNLNRSFHYTCSSNELLLNCTVIEKYLNKKSLKRAQEMYQRCAFQKPNGTTKIVDIKSTTILQELSLYNQECERDFCSKRASHKKKKDWATFWKPKFDKCLAEKLVLTCSNITAYMGKKLEEAQDLYRKISFISEDKGKTYVSNTSRANLNLWIKLCPSTLTVSCANYSKYFTKQSDFKQTKQRYLKAIFHVENVDEKFNLAKETSKLSTSFVNEYAAACKDPAFKQTPCKDRYEKLKHPQTYKRILRSLFYACSLHELLMNCTNIHKFSQASFFNEKTNRYPRIVLSYGTSRIKIINARESDIATEINAFYKHCYPNSKKTYRENYPIVITDEVTHRREMFLTKSPAAPKISRGNFNKSALNYELKKYRNILRKIKIPDTSREILLNLLKRARWFFKEPSRNPTNTTEAKDTKATSFL